MFDTLSILAASLVICGIFVISYGYLYYIEKHRYILLWTFSWGMIFIAYLTRFILLEHTMNTVLLIINYATTLAGSWILYMATASFLRKKPMPWLHGFYTVILLWSVLHIIMKTSDNYYLIPSAVLISITYIYLGNSFYKSNLPDNSIKNFIGHTFVLWGVTILLGPLSRNGYINSSLMYLISGTCGVMTAINLIAIYFQMVKNELLCKEIKIRHLTYCDSITGLYNRNYLENNMSHIDIADNLPISIIYGDMNGLKLINDTLGHHNGDLFLKQMAELLKSTCADDNILIRLGGDEFIILLLKTHLSDAHLTSSKIHDACAQENISIIPISIALGTAMKADMNECIIDTMKNAEELMYHNKLKEGQIYRNTIISFLQRLLLEKDYQNEEHLADLKLLADKMGTLLKLTEAQKNELVLAADLHDVGKITISEKILKKPGPLNNEEWEIIKKHVDTGYRIAQSVNQLSHISQTILCHHEWWDGSGYPSGLAGEEIPYYARILSIIDAYNVMTHPRPYQAIRTSEEALMEVKSKAGEQFDPALVMVFEECIKEMFPSGVPKSVSDECIKAVYPKSVSK